MGKLKKDELERKIKLFLIELSDQELEQFSRETLSSTVLLKRYAKEEREIRKSETHTEKISREVDLWPEWKRNLSGFRSNYCSELQPVKNRYP